ncbi:MAG: ISKra4 family transposase [Pedosphaera sp.]|nr:ISKra4 family transposase [Pedosphaera sp.]
MKWFLNDELLKQNPSLKPRRPLEQRLAQRPAVRARLHQLAATLDESVGDDPTADQAEERVTEQVRRLALEVLGQWAREANAHTQAQVMTHHPEASHHGKKKTLNWQTTFGWVSVAEAQWRLGRRGKLLRPFCERAGVRPRGRSRRLQRALVDFGAEESFARATARVQEHDGLDVAAEIVRQQTLAHGAQVSALQVPPPQSSAATLVTQLDGCLIPIVVPPTTGADRRRGKQLLGREARLCLARPQDSVTPRYGATLGSVALTGALWRDTALAAGLGERTHGHGVGDGAEWILTQFQEQFGDQGGYLVAFYHVSEYLAAAALVIQSKDPQGWRRRPQGRLLENKVTAVLRALTAHLEPEGISPAPVRAAHRYVSQRRHHLDYAGARAAELCIGSGEIESGHRHVIQQRRKLAGSWGQEPSAEAMLGLRVARAKNLWHRYWSVTQSALN